MAAATPVKGGNTLGCMGSFSVMLFLPWCVLLAIVRAAVSIYGQRTVAEISSQRTVAEINTLVLERGLRASSVTVSPEFLCFYLRRRPEKPDFE